METRRRKNARLSRFDYSRPGAYFVTVCTDKRVCFLGEVVDGCVVLSKAGVCLRNSLAPYCREESAARIEDSVIMPNHWHALIRIERRPEEKAGAMNCAPTKGGTVKSIKAAASILIRREVDSRFTWQKNYYEHVVRDEQECLRIREYIQDNPRRWAEDPENSEIISAPGALETWR